MYCVEYWSERDPSIAMLGKSIPEPFCKDDIIQKNLARTAGLSMFFRMIPSMIGAIPIGYLADRYGRKPMLVIHKLNVCVSCAAQVLICKYCGPKFIFALESSQVRSALPQTPNLDTLPYRPSWLFRRQL